MSLIDRLPELAQRLKEEAPVKLAEAEAVKAAEKSVWTKEVVRLTSMAESLPVSEAYRNIRPILDGIYLPYHRLSEDGYRMEKVSSIRYREGTYDFDSLLIPVPPTYKWDLSWGRESSASPRSEYKKYLVTNLRLDEVLTIDGRGFDWKLPMTSSLEEIEDTLGMAMLLVDSNVGRRLARVD